MEIGETVTGVQAMIERKQCVICDKQHEAPKDEPVEPTVGKSGWERDKSMSGVFDGANAERCKIYKDNTYPPQYTSEGHHSLAYSSFVKNGKDELQRLNHFLNSAGFRPNDSPNIIQLPGRGGDPGAPAALEKSFQAFWVSVESGKPLQLHVGRHKTSYFAKSEILVRRIAELISSPTRCEQSDLNSLKEKLKWYADRAVNHAFTCVATATGGWVCHPEKLLEAQGAYRDHSGQFSPSAWPEIRLNTVPFR
ncbi:hypothetical protein WME90_42835 [Sorangium sp. So ce375]|uniref:hypothetical protein n=1 Tax=Sorangium sp. So ce375 TaxID=3133306 RepID=UPI003F5C8890